MKRPKWTPLQLDRVFIPQDGHELDRPDDLVRTQHIMRVLQFGTPPNPENFIPRTIVEHKMRLFGRRPIRRLFRFRMKVPPDYIRMPPDRPAEIDLIVYHRHILKTARDLLIGGVVWK